MLAHPLYYLNSLVSHLAIASACSLWSPEGPELIKLPRAKRPLLLQQLSCSSFGISNPLSFHSIFIARSVCISASWRRYFCPVIVERGSMIIFFSVFLLSGFTFSSIFFLKWSDVITNPKMYLADSSLRALRSLCEIL